MIKSIYPNFEHTTSIDESGNNKLLLKTKVRKFFKDCFYTIEVAKEFHVESFTDLDSIIAYIKMFIKECDNILTYSVLEDGTLFKGVVQWEKCSSSLSEEDRKHPFRILNGMNDI